MKEIRHRVTGAVLYEVGNDSLRGADLRGADLIGANLIEAELGGADLREAELGGANLSVADLRGTKVSLRADWPELLGMILSDNPSDKGGGA